MAEIKGWFTMNGMHIPIMEGQSRAEAAKNYISYNKKIQTNAHKKMQENKEADTSKDNKKYKEYNEKNIDYIELDNPDIIFDPDLYETSQIDALNKYVSDSGLINMGESSYKDTIKEIDSCITEKTQTDLYTYRGIAAKASELNVGDVITNKGFTSTSILESVASEFANEYDGCTIKIKVNKGTEALYLGNYKTDSFQEFQAELLFARNASIRITGKDSKRIYGELYYENKKSSSNNFKYKDKKKVNGEWVYEY